MFKQAAYAVAAAAAFVASPAAAVVVINDTITIEQFGNVFVGGTQATVNDTDPLFELNYTFAIPVDAYGATQVSTITVGGSAVTFTNVSLNGSALTFTGLNAQGGQVYAINNPFLAGVSNLLEIDGSVAGAARIGTELNISAVPEPTTWALLILGFGAVGHTMRRRSSKVRVGKASLNFA